MKPMVADSRRRLIMPETVVPGSAWVAVLASKEEIVLRAYIPPPDLVPGKSIFDGLRPMTKAEAKACYAPDPEFDALEAALAKHPFTPEEPE